MTGVASSLIALALGDADLAATCPTFRSEYQITPDGRIRINYPAAAPWPDPTPEPDEDEPTYHDLLTVVAEQHREADREERAS